MKYLKEYNKFNESVKSDEYYYEISRSEMEKIPKSDFVDIDSRVFSLVKDHLTDWILDNCPKISVKMTNDNWIGLNKIGIQIVGFDFYKEKKHQHSEVPFPKNIRISQLTDDWFLTAITSVGYSIYFKCDQIDGLMKFLEDYHICGWNRMKGD